MGRLVVIGHGMAATRLVERLVDQDPKAYDIILIGEERYPGYDRIQLSQVLSGTAQAESLALKDRHWYDIHNIELRTGEKIVSVNPREKSVFTNQGSCLHYDELVFATGSVPLRIPIPGANLDGVMTFRTLDDCETMGSLAETHTPIVVIGGGLLGLEAANGLLSLGMEVTVVHGVKTLMERQLDSQAAKLLERELNRLGLKLELDRLTTRILGRDHVEGVEFADGTRILARHVVMAVGIRPNVEVAETAGLSLNRGIVVDDFMATSEPNIWAVGECAEHNGILYGIVAPLYDQVEVFGPKTLKPSRKSLCWFRAGDQVKSFGSECLFRRQFS